MGLCCQSGFKLSHSVSVCSGINFGLWTFIFLSFFFFFFFFFFLFVCLFVFVFVFFVFFFVFSSSSSSSSPPPNSPPHPTPPFYDAFSQKAKPFAFIFSHIVKLIKTKLYLVYIFMLVYIVYVTLTWIQGHVVWERKNVCENHLRKYKTTWMGSVDRPMNLMFRLLPSIDNQGKVLPLCYFVNTHTHTHTHIHSSARAREKPFNIYLQTFTNFFQVWQGDRALCILHFDIGFHDLDLVQGHGRMRTHKLLCSLWFSRNFFLWLGWRYVCYHNLLVCSNSFQIYFA